MSDYDIIAIVVTHSDDYATQRHVNMCIKGIDNIIIAGADGRSDSFVARKATPSNSGVVFTTGSNVLRCMPYKIYGVGKIR